MTLDREISLEQKALIIDAFSSWREQCERVREYARTAPQSATATKLNRRRSHGELLELRSRSIFGLVLTLREVLSQYAKRTTEVLGSVEQSFSSLLYCHGPPLRNGSRTFLFDYSTRLTVPSDKGNYHG